MKKFISSMIFFIVSWIFLISLIIILSMDKSSLIVCRPNAYYGKSQMVTDPACSPSDPNCAVDPCR